MRLRMARRYKTVAEKERSDSSSLKEAKPFEIQAARYKDDSFAQESSPTGLNPESSFSFN